MLSTGRQGSSKSTPGVRTFKTFGVRAQQLPKARIVDSELVKLPAFFKDSILNDGILDLKFIAFDFTVNAAEGGFPFLVLVTARVVG